MATVIVPSIPSVPRSLESDAKAWCSAVKYSLDLREGRIDGTNRFVSAGEVEGFIREVYSTAKGKTFIKRVANFLGESSSNLEADIYLSDITGDGLVVISAGGQIVIANPGGLIISGDGTLLVDTGAYDDPDGEGILVGDIASGYGWAMNAAGLFSWWDTMPLHAFVTEDGTGTGIAWQQSTAHGLEPIDGAFKVYTGDAVIGGYNYEVTASGDQLGGLFWDQSAGILHIRGDIKNAVVDTGGVLTVQNTGYIYIEASTNTSGLLIGSLNSVTGWKINSTGMYGFNGTGGVHAFCLTNGTSWQGNTINAGDAVLGGYFTSSGVWWDDSEGKLFVKGEIVSGTVGAGSNVTISSTGLVTINTSQDGSGLLVSGWVTAGTATGILLNNKGLFMAVTGTGVTGHVHAFALDTVSWQGDSLAVGDVVIGQYFNGSGGIYWKQATSVLRIKGRAITLEMIANGTFTISSTGYIFINTSEANSGLMIGTITPSGGTGWLINSTGLFGYTASVGYFAMALATVSWDGGSIATGDVVIGRYISGNSGLWWDQSSGIFYIRGRIVSGTITTGGSLYMDGGTMVIEAGSISISGTTAVSISAGSGLTIASGSKITVNSTDGILLSTIGTLYYSAAGIFLSTASYELDLYSGGDMTIYTGANMLLIGDTVVVQSPVLKPDTTGRNLGTTSAYWNDVYGDTYYQKTPGSADDSVTSFDHLDDLAIVNKYGGPDMVEPFHVLPIECTNIAVLAKEEGISIDEVYKRPDLWKRIFYNPLMVGIFGIGSIKQLCQRVADLEKRLN